VLPAGVGEGGAALHRRLLLVGLELEVLGRQLEAQGAGSQRVGHVLVAFPAVLQQERTPVRLRGAHQLQALREERRHTGRGGGIESDLNLGGGATE